MDLDFEVCGEYKLTSPTSFTYQHVKDWPLEKCNGVFGFTKSEAPKVLRWAEQTNTYIDKKCK